jgi:hypothetical protein
MSEESIALLEQEDWGEPPADAPPSVVRCYRLRRASIESLTLADVRLLLGFGIGLPYLVPIAIKALKRQPLIKTEYFCGDLLANILTVSPEFYSEHHEYKNDVASIMSSYPYILESLDPIDARYAAESIEKAILAGRW